MSPLVNSMVYPPTFLVYTERFKLTLTSLRKAVLFTLWCHQKPLKAYDILEMLAKEQPHATAAAVYRALGFFVTAGVVHKIDTIQSYALCREPETKACSEVLLVCSLCHDVCETDAIIVRETAEHVAFQGAFQLSHEPIELRGVCGRCSEGAMV